MVRGDIYLVNLDPTVGHEIQKTRPCVIVSPPEIHNHLKTALIAPMTTGNRPAPFRVEVSFQGKTGLILTEQIRAVDKVRLVKKIGALDNETLKQLLSILQQMFSE
ncbi:type II toxin-antitoxin system PemK/MazF family toxin [Aggregatibacter kilianii]|uniref:type II toxin-antitoxin system PemK/MazF family toxin n=1 Tax=Aggregatibacter kilianii TaxID=2025884 RepID=UPI00195516B2|nr:type II toxin-antitoxin system PemK/MazF family toxin [Aggregatibacter kilianii]